MRQAAEKLDRPCEGQADQIHGLLERVTRAWLKGLAGDLDDELALEARAVLQKPPLSEATLVPEGVGTTDEDGRTSMRWRRAAQLIMEAVPTVFALLALSISAVLAMVLWQQLPPEFEIVRKQLPEDFKDARWIATGLFTVGVPMLLANLVKRLRKGAGTERGAGTES